MDDSQELETLQEQSRWSAKRVVLIYWFALMFLGSGVAIGLGFTALSPTYTPTSTYDHSTIANPHPENCTECHDDTVQDWNDTGHAYPHTYGWQIVENTTASPSYWYVNWTNLGRTVNWTTADGHGFADYCAHCWTTGWQNVTSPDPLNPPWTYWGVTCTSCHSPAGSVDHTAENCLQCHGGSHDLGHSLSAHNRSIGILARSYASDECAHCVTGQSTYAHQDELTKANIANLNSIACATCHDPHSAEHELQLRNNDTVEFCGACHGTDPEHHTTYEFWTDSGNKHRARTDQCTTCHGYELVWSSRYGRWSPEVNHTWEIFLPDACNQSGCHSPADNMDATTAITAWEATAEDIEDLIADWEALNDTVVGLIVAGTADDWRLDAAEALHEDSLMLLHYVESDPGVTFHNPALAKTKLDAAIDKLEMAKTLLEEECYSSVSCPPPFTTCPEEDDGAVPGFTFLGALLAISLLGAAALFLRRRRA